MVCSSPDPDGLVCSGNEKRNEVVKKVVDTTLGQEDNPEQSTNNGNDVQ